MGGTSEILFYYLRDVFSDAPKAVLDIEKLDEDYVMLGKGLVYFAQSLAQCNKFAQSLAKGDLSATPPPPGNEMAAPLKSLHASLRHLTWQSQQVAKGDYKQRVDFMGEFADAFNMMVEQLAERQQKLEEAIELSRKHAKALEQSNQLLSSVTRHIPQQIFVIDADTNEILLMNDMAKLEIENDSGYLNVLMKNVIGIVPDYKEHGGICNVEIQYCRGDIVRCLSITPYCIEWNAINAVAFVINDISDNKKQITELENYAYRDSLTNLYNRFYGMLVLQELLDTKKRFVLIFLDLDNLKYINDKYGHNEGDTYIINTAKHLRTFSQNAVVCRLGGDEFMLLMPEIGSDEAYSRMTDIQDAIQSDGYLQGKDYRYSISFGIVAVEENCGFSSSGILSLADERMYEHKRARKKERQNQYDL